MLFCTGTEDPMRSLRGCRALPLTPTLSRKRERGNDTRKRERGKGAHATRRLPGVFLLLALLLAGGVARAADGDVQAIPELHARVTDLVGALPAQRREQVEQRLAALEQRKGAQIAVLLVATTAPEPIEAYATRVFDAWKLGRKGIDDGVLVVVAKDDRRTRIEVGYGLEGAIPDAAAKRVMHDYMSPKFAAGDFAGGVDIGVDWLTRLIDGEPLPTAPVALSSHQGIAINADDEPWWSPLQFVIGIMFGAFVAVLFILFLGNRTLYLFSLGRLPERARTYAFGVITPYRSRSSCAIRWRPSVRSRPAARWLRSSGSASRRAAAAGSRAAVVVAPPTAVRADRRVARAETSAAVAAVRAAAVHRTVGDAQLKGATCTPHQSTRE